VQWSVMCGRTSCTLSPEEILVQTKATTFDDKEHFVPSYNVPPQAHQPVLMMNEGRDRVVRAMKWGLVPSWSDDGTMKVSTINARAETLTTQKMWRGVVKRNRCLVLASGYYEWQKTRGTKQPYYIHHKNPDHLLMMAGLYDVWIDPKTGEKKFTCTIVTCDPSPAVAHIHDRMPVILGTEEARQAWLNADGAEVSAEILSLLQPYEGDDIEVTKVGSYVNSTKHNGPRCIKPQEEEKSIKEFFEQKEEKVPEEEEEEKKTADEDEKEEEKGTKRKAEAVKTKKEKKEKGHKRKKDDEDH